MEQTLETRVLTLPISVQFLAQQELFMLEVEIIQMVILIQLNILLLDQREMVQILEILQLQDGHQVEIQVQTLELYLQEVLFQEVFQMLWIM